MYNLFNEIIIIIFEDVYTKDITSLQVTLIAFRKILMILCPSVRLTAAY